LAKLGALGATGDALATAYRGAILEPMYAKLLAMAFRLGVIQAVSEPFDVSIVMPVGADAGRARDTLTRLAEVTAGADFEVVIVDDAAGDETRAILATLGGDVRILRNDLAVGDVRACNQAAGVARGRFPAVVPPGPLPCAGWPPAPPAHG